MCKHDNLSSSLCGRVVRAAVRDFHRHYPSSDIADEREDAGEKPMKLSGAFTILELLIVVAIIGVLAGILLAAFHTVRERSKVTTCLSNLRQIGMALALYRQDYNGVDAVSGQEMEYWQLGVPSFSQFEQFRRQYVKDDRVFHCPGYFGWIDPFTYAGLPLQRVNTYQWCVESEDMPVPEEQRFAKRVARMGDRVVVCICEVHNPPASLDAPSTARKRVNILRLSQQVESKWVPLRSTVVEVEGW